MGGYDVSTNVNIAAQSVDTVIATFVRATQDMQSCLSAAASQGHLHILRCRTYKQVTCASRTPGWTLLSALQCLTDSGPLMQGSAGH